MHAFESERPSNYLARLAATDLGRAYKEMVVREMEIEPGHTVLDLGCGPGTDLAAFAAATGREGHVLGIDHDGGAIADAAQRLGGDPSVQIAVGDVHALPLPGRSVDRVHTDRVLQHVDSPAAVVSEAVRVLRPGGIAAFAEPDWDTLVIDYPDPAVAVAYRSFITDHGVRNARVGRQLPDICERQGLRRTRVIPVTAVYRDAAEADRVLGFERVTTRAVDGGYLSARDGAAWLHHLRTGGFFASVSLFVTLAQRAD